MLILSFLGAKLLAKTSDGKTITGHWISSMLDEEISKIQRNLGEERFR